MEHHIQSLAKHIELIAWDFDGVLNRNIEDGEFIWSRNFQADFGVPVSALQQYLFVSGRMKSVFTGQRDFRDLIIEWIETEGHNIDPDRLIDYWFRNDDHPDQEMINLVERLPHRQIIATNNEARRERFITEQAGWGERVEKIFAAGPMGVAKPDADFFQIIEDWSEVRPECILLVDDLQSNLDAAAARGWQTLLFTDQTRSSALASLLALTSEQSRKA